MALVVRWDSWPRKDAEVWGGWKVPGLVLHLIEIRKVYFFVKTDIPSERTRSAFGADIRLERPHKLSVTASQPCEDNCLEHASTHCLLTSCGRLTKEGKGWAGLQCNSITSIMLDVKLLSAPTWICRGWWCFHKPWLAYMAECSIKRVTRIALVHCELVAVFASQLKMSRWYYAVK